MDISSITDILFSGSVKDIALNLVRDGVQAGLEDFYVNVQFNEAIEDYLAAQNPAVKEQLEALIAEFKQDLKDQIVNKDIHLIDELNKQMDVKLQEGEFPEECRKGLKAHFMLFVLRKVENIDVYYANDLKIVLEVMEERQRNLSQDAEIKKLKEEIWIIRQALKNILQEQASPLKAAPVCLQLDDSPKIMGHEDLLDDIKNMYAQGSNVVFLCGRPGMGKTTLARRYARISCKKHDVYFVTYEKSIKDTIGKLAKDDLKNGSEKILEYWGSAELERPVLLVIDNFNENPLQRAGEQEMEDQLEGSFYQKMADTGIHVLFTTRTMMGRNAIEVTPVEDRFRLFENYYERPIEGDSVKSTINKIIDVLHGNTLLIILVANILKRSDIEKKAGEVLERLRKCNMWEESTELDLFADIPNGDVKTIYEQAHALLDMSGIWENDAAKSVFANTALLPLDGMKKQEFLDLTGNKNDNVLMQLINSSWILTDSVNVYLHPMVREIALRDKCVSYGLCEICCKNIHAKIAMRETFKDRLKYKNYAQEIYNVFKADTSYDQELLRLFYDLSDIYDGLAERELSLEIVKVVQDNIAVFDESPLEKAQILSGIAYSYNNCFDTMEMLEEAWTLLEQAQNTTDEITPDQSNRDQRTRIQGQILSNRGSNCLAKSKCNQVQRQEALKQALQYHNQALELRQIQYERLLSKPEEKARQEARRMKEAVATSYTTIATDYFYLSDYEQAITQHEQALKIREEQQNEKGESINQQRIIGCVIEIYRQQLSVGEEYIAQVLSYYPRLLEINYKYQNITALKDNIRYLIEIQNIVLNDRRLERFVGDMAGKCQGIKKWVDSDDRLKEMLADEIQRLQD